MRNLLHSSMRWFAVLLLLSGAAVAQAPAQTETSQISAPPNPAKNETAGNSAQKGGAEQNRKPGHPRVLIVVAHPDDESCFAATVYEITHNLGGTVDQLVITNGEGGYRYSLLAESYYGVKLTDEAVGRAKLPEIRKRELLEAGGYLGINDHFFLNQRDVRNTKDIDEVLEQHWVPGVALAAVGRRLATGHYDFVFTLFPSPETHGAHKAATITALDAVRQMAAREMPVVLGCQTAPSKPEAGAAGAAADSAQGPSSTPNTPTAGAQGTPAGSAHGLSWKGFESKKYPFQVMPDVFVVDRNVKFGFKNVLSYQIIVSWMVAAHKSQGAFQAAAPTARGDLEEFVILDGGARPVSTEQKASGSARARRLFQALAEQAPHPRELVEEKPAPESEPTPGATTPP